MLKTISQRLRGVGEDAEEGVQGKLQEAFDQLGINIQIVNSETGEMASTYDILGAIADKWTDLTQAQQQYIGEQAAGKLRIQQFNALMTNFDHVVEATNTAMNSAGITAQQYGVYTESLEGKQAALKSQIQELSQELEPLVVKFVDLGTNLLKFANTGMGEATIKAVAMGAAVAVLLSQIPKIIAGIKSIGAALSTSQGIWGLIATALATIVTYLISLPSRMDALNEKIDETNNKISTAQQKIEELKASGGEETIIQLYTNQVRQLNEQLDELNEKKFNMIFRESSLTSDVAGTTDQITAAYEAWVKARDDAAKAMGTDAYEDAKKEADEAWATYEKLSQVQTTYGTTYADAINDVNEATKRLADSISVDEYEKNLELWDDAIATLQDYTVTVYNAIKANKSLTEEQWKQYAQATQLLGMTQETVRAKIALNTINEQYVHGAVTISNALREEAYAAGLTDEEINLMIASTIAYNNTTLNFTDKMRSFDLLSQSVSNASLSYVQSLLQMAKADALMEGKNWGYVVQTNKNIQSLQALAVEASTHSGLTTGYGNTLTYVGGNEQTYSIGSGSISSGSSSSSSSSSATDANKEAFDAQYTALRHNLTMGYITQEQYYNSLEQLYKRYFSDLTKYQEEYWQYEEEVYKGRKQLAEDLMEAEREELENYYQEKIDALQETNDELQREYDLQQALLDLETARQKKLLVYSNGSFTYAADYSSIASAAYKVQSLQRDSAISLLEKQKTTALEAYDSGSTLAEAKLAGNAVSLGTYSTNTTNSGETFNLNGSLVFPNVTNQSGIENFVAGVKQLAYQKAYSNQ